MNVRIPRGLIISCVVMLLTIFTMISKPAEYSKNKGGFAELTVICVVAGTYYYLKYKKKVKKSTAVATAINSQPDFAGSENYSQRRLLIPILNDQNERLYSNL